MTAIIEEFISEVVHRTIISREQNKSMKGNIKVYGRSHDEVRVKLSSELKVRVDVDELW